MKGKIQDKNKIGIYLIRNIVTGKVYIGQSTNIYRRIVFHRYALNKGLSKQENEYFIKDWQLFGEVSFDYVILEEIEDVNLLVKREQYWINFYDSSNIEKGYNLRIDTNEGMLLHNTTKSKLSIATSKRFENPEERIKIGIKSKEFWKNNLDKKDEMASKMKKIKQKFRFFKMDEQNNILETFESLDEIIEKYPTYKWQNIYAVCNGYKKRMYGFKWKKEQKI